MSHVTPQNNDAQSAAGPPGPDAPEPDDQRDRSTDRRTFIKGCMILAGSAAGMKYGSTEARAALPLAPIGYAAGGAAIGYLASEAADYFLGDERDYSTYTGEEALRSELMVGAAEMQSADERVMTSISNNVTNADNIALAKGKAAIIEEMNAGNPEQDAQNAMADAIDQYFTTVLQNALTHNNTQIEQLLHHLEQQEAHENINTTVEGDATATPVAHSSASTGNQWDEYDDLGPKENPHSITVEPIVGHPVEVKFLLVAKGDYHDVVAPEWACDNYAAEMEEEVSHIATIGAGTPVSIGYYDRETATLEYEVPTQFETNGEVTQDRVSDNIRDLLAARDDVNAQLSGFVTDVYAAYEPGEIPTEDIVDPITASTQLRQDYDGYQSQGAHAAMLGIPTTAEQSVAMTIHGTDDSGTDTDYSVFADLFTQHVPTDGSGNEIGFESGTTYDPATWDEPLYIAYEYQEETDDGTETQTDFVQLEDSFTIDSVTDRDGNDVQSFQTQSRNIQTADVESLQDELDQLRQAQLDMQEEAQSGGGGISLDDFAIGQIPGVGVVLVIVGVIAALVGSN